MDKELTKRFALLFRGLERSYFTFQLKGKKASGKTEGYQSAVHEKRSLTTFEDHLNGKLGIAIVPINEKNACFWGALDIDQYPLDHSALVKNVQRHKLPLVVCRSKSGGGHLYLFLKEAAPAETLKTKLKEIASEIGLARTPDGTSETEIFPKQIEHSNKGGKGKDTGSGLNLPYYDHENGLRYAFNPDGSAATLQEFIEMAEAASITPEELGKLVQKEDVTVDERLKFGPPCLQTLLRQGFPEGTRNNGLFNLGVYLRKAFPNEWETKILEYNQAVLEPPLDLQEVNVVADQIRKKDYQYKCSDQPISSFCNRDLCRSRRYGVGGSTNTARVANLRKYDSEPPLWFLDVNGRPVELDTDALQRQPRFQILCMEQINEMPSTITRQAWEAQMNSLLSAMVQTEGAIISTSEDTSIRGQFYELLEEFTTHMQSAVDREEILLRRPWTNGSNNRTYFRMKDLEAYLKRQKFNDYRSNKIAQRLRDIDGMSEQLSVNGRPIRCWSIPAFEPIEDEFNSKIEDDDEVPF